jgi:23S rRNA-/tRNA-specific pseudouridylate synthase
MYRLTDQHLNNKVHVLSNYRADDIHHLMTTSAIDKRYMCVCYGQMQLSGVIEEPIARDSLYCTRRH